MYKAAFWTLIIITTISLALQIGGYVALETVIFLIIMDFIALWIYLEKRNSLAEIDSNVIKKIENLETACSSILENVSSVPLVLNLEEKINRQKEDVSLLLEKINEKTSALEEKINNFGQSLSAPDSTQKSEDKEYVLLE